MNIRDFRFDDIIWEKKIYDKFHSENEYPAFENQYHSAFIVENNAGRIVLAGGVRPIAEIVMLSDLTCSSRDRIEASMKLLEVGIYSAAKFNYNQLHAFTHPLSKWGSHLAKVGFKRSENVVHILDLKNG